MTVLNDINPIVDVLKNLSERGIKCNLLVGAGCSVTAGIPTADGIMKIIKERFPSIYSMVEKKTYANCMNALSPDERIDLIKNLVNNAKLNISHILIAQLLKGGYIHRILTPNFDNLLIKACSIINEFPPIYDLAAYEEFKPEHIPEKCIFYLHGQFTGFRLVNTKEEIIKQATRLEPLFRRLNERSVWIVIGYSGLNDALFQLLSKEKVFANRLFWIGFDQEEPHQELTKNILQQGKYGFYIKGYDSDNFFWSLAQKTGEFPPEFLLKPFSYIKNIMEQIVPYQPRENRDFSKPTIGIIQNAIKKYETDSGFMAECYYNCGLYDEVISRKDILSKKKLNWLVSSAYFNKAYDLYDEANGSKELYNQVIELYDLSNKLARYHGCYNNIALCYYKLAELDKDNIDQHLSSSFNNYLLALENGNQKAFNNFLDAVILFLESKLNNKNYKNLIRKIKNLGDKVQKSKLQQDYIDWTNLVIENLNQIDFNNIEFKQYLEMFLKHVEKKLKQTA